MASPICEECDQEMHVWAFNGESGFSCMGCGWSIGEDEVEPPEPAGCSKCGSTSIHACTGAPIPEWTPEKISEMKEVLSRYQN